MLRNFRLAHAAAAVALLGVSALTAKPSHAGSYTYNTEQRVINAGILIVQDSATTPPQDLQNYDPYPFFILNQRSDVKPAGWSIVNPMSPKVVDTVIQAKWDAIAKQIPTDPYGVTGGSHVYQIGAPITQDMAPYWEVTVTPTTTMEDLRQFNILYMSVRGDIQFTAHQKEMLRQYVDGGGQLLVETTPVNTNPNSYNAITDLFVDVKFTGGDFKQANLPVVGGPFRHPILSEPNMLAQGELLSLGHSGELGNNNFGAVQNVFAASPDPYGLLSAVLNNQNNDAVIEAGQLGAGEVVIDTTASCHAINGFLGGYDVTGGLAAPYAYTAPNSGPFCNSSIGGAIASGVSSEFALAPIADMKFLVNVMSWSGVHNSESGNAHQNSASSDVMASAIIPTWSASATTSFGSFTAPAAPLYTAGSPGAAIFGHYVAVVDKDYILHVYDLVPSENLSSGFGSDDGLADYQTGTSYDEIWRSKKPNNPMSMSAPTIATKPGGVEPLIFVEMDDGSVDSYNLTTGATFVNELPASAAKYSTFGIAVPPSPTYYNGRLYVGRPDGKVAIDDYARSQRSAFTLVPGPLPYVQTNPQPVIAPPAVAVNWLNGDNNQLDSNDLVLYVSTPRFIYTIFLATYNETLMSGSGSTYLTKIASNNPPSEINLSLWNAFTLQTNGAYNVNGYEVQGAGTPSNGPPQFTSVLASPPPTMGVDYYAIVNGMPAQGLARTVIGTSHQANSYSSPSFGVGANPVYVSAPAVDKNGYAYVSVTDPTLGDSSVECIQDSISGANRRIRWRFRLPSSNDGGALDASGVDYSSLTGWHFIGAPVIDRNGFVYALAADRSTTKTAVLCFDTNQAVTADLFGVNGTSSGTVAGYTIVQSGSTSGTSEFNQPALPIIQGLQFNGGADGHIEFTNFAAPPNSGATSGQYPSLSEPQPVQISYTLYDGTNNIPVGPVSVPLKTNMRWCVTGTTAGPVSAGLTLVGDYVFFGDTKGNVYRVGTQISSSVINQSLRFIAGTANVDVNKKKLWASQSSGIDVIDSLPASGSGSLVVNGYNVDSTGKTHSATAALQNQKTLVLDGDRLVEVDAAGDLIWGVDSTTKGDVVGGTLDTTGSGAGGSKGKIAISHSDLNHPAGLSQYDQNNYLIADTGNNRCVEMDRSGKVVWELTSFRDPKGVLANSGQPTTLNHPTSIQKRRVYRKILSNTYITYAYLIADTGNHRIIEVADTFNQQGTPVTENNHTLKWVSHTYDDLGRKYNYVGADYFVDPAGGSYIVGLISNYRVGPLPASVNGVSAVPVGVQGAIGGDSPGGSIVMLDYNTVGSGATQTAKQGYIHVDVSGTNYKLRSFSDFDAYLLTAGTDANKFDVQTAVKATANGTLGTGINNTISFVSPRFLKTYVTPYGSGATATPSVNFLIADRNGAFDLKLVNSAAAPSNSLAFYRPTTQWGFTNEDYKQMMTPVKLGDVSFERTNIPFGASSIQLVGRELVDLGGTNYPIGQYLIASSTPQGDAGSAKGSPGYTIRDELRSTSVVAPRIGGEVFYLHYNKLYTGVPSPASPASGVTIPYTNAYWDTQAPTISRPENSGPLAEPMAALQPL